MTGMILTTESIPKYLKEHWELLGLTSDNNAEDALKGIEVNTIQGGNVNYAFCIKFPSMGGDNGNGKTVFLKQAPEFVAIFGPDGFPLTSERMQRELDVYSEYKTILGDTLSKKYLPDIYYFDKKHMIVIMEFLDGHDLLDHALVSKSSSDDYNEEKIAEYLGDFMGRVHSATHSLNVSNERCDYLTKHFENREMRDVQLEFVFTKCYKEATNEQRSGLTLTPEFMKEVELLKNQYNGDGVGTGHVLCHGDLHPGSVMVNTTNGSTKVIDPEFTVYGPAGLDAGSLLHGYCLGAIHQAYSNNPNAVERIISSAETLWYAYKKALMNNDNSSSSSGSGGISADTMKEIEIETVGFTVAEVCRTCLGFAGGRLWLQFDNIETKSASKEAALQLVDKCMIARHDGGIDLLFNELKKICSSI